MEKQLISCYTCSKNIYAKKCEHVDRCLLSEPSRFWDMSLYSYISIEFENIGFSYNFWEPKNEFISKKEFSI